MSFIYLASPYTPHAGESMQERCNAACKAAAQLMQAGHSVFSPIAHSHYVAQYLPPETSIDHHFWMEQDLAILRHASKVVVLCLPGWGNSKGVACEIMAATAALIPVEYMDA